jgi:hypothetical protein
MTHDEDSVTKPTIIDLDPDQVVEADEPKSTGAQPVKNAGTQRRFLLWSTAALVTAAVAGGWFYRDVLAAYFPSDQLQATQVEIKRLETDNKSLNEDVARFSKLADALTKSVNSLESKATNSSSVAEAASASVKDQGSQVAQLFTDLDATKKAIAELNQKSFNGTNGTNGAVTSVDSTALSGLVARIDAMEKDIASLKAAASSGGGANATELSQSLADLNAKIAAGVGFAPELERIQRMVPAAPGLDVLASHSQQGLPDSKGLGAELTALAQTFPKPAAVAETEEDGLLSNAWKTISGMVRVRNIGEADWPVAAADAASLAAEGNLRQAIDRLNGIEGAKPAGLSQWIERAEARLKIEAILQGVGEAVMRSITAKG